MNNKIDGREWKTIKSLDEKMQAMSGLIALMVKLKLNQRTLASLADVPYETVRKMIQQPRHGTKEQWNHLLKVALKRYEEINND